MKKKIKITTTQKIMISELISLLIFALLAFSAILLLTISANQTGWVQNLLVGLGTGAATSALVSLAFYLNDKQIKKRESLKLRNKFMESFKAFYYKTICAIDFAKIEEFDITLTLEEYIKLQHRWFHEYYKRKVANNTSKEETEIRVSQIKEFISSLQTSFYSTFEFSSNWKDSDFTQWQLRELSTCCTDFKNMQLYVANNDYFSAFLEFAEFLECIKRMAKEFPEIDNFNLLSFKSNGDVIEVYWEDFEKVETMFKFARSFNNIRRNNYKKYYSYQKENKQP